MRRICVLSLLFVNLGITLLLGCGQKPADSDAGKGQQNVQAGEPKDKPGALPWEPLKAPSALNSADANGIWQASGLTPPDPEQEKYDAALQAAIDFLGQKKYGDALIALEAAAKFKDTELVRTEIQKLRLRLEQQNAAERTLQDIQSILDQGNVAEAGRLATAALQEYGSTDVGPALIKLKLQVDALAGMQLNDNAARHKAFREQGESAEKQDNLRAALIAYEQAMQFGDDVQTRNRHELIRVKLAKYDDHRQKAAELRKDPADLDEALELLKEAATQWNTPQIRQDIDEYSLALQQRRDRIAVADFEVRGDVGIPMAGRTVAEELLPHFKGRFDLVERAQIAKVLEELKLESGNLTGGDDQREVGKVAKVGYLVVGSVSRFGGIVVGARLVDAQSGLVVQTAKITAASPEEALTKLPELAKLLMMSDQERMAYDQELMKQAPPVPLVQVQQPLPPPPEIIQPGQLLQPAPVIVSEVPPGFGGVKVDDFKVFQPEPQPIIYGGAAEEIWKQKALHASLLLGDDLFRHGRHHEALRRFEFGLTLGSGRFELDIRINRLRPLLPPPPVVIVVPPPPPPRIAIIDFVVVGNPFETPPGLSWTTPRGLAPYFSPPYELVDRGELYWWMGRLGMTVRDLMVDPYARRWLGRALNVRYFVFGTITQTGSFNVDTYMVDAEHGFLAGRGFVHVHNQVELRYRLGELAALTQMSPNLWQQQQQQYRAYEGLVAQAHLAAGRNDFVIAINFIRDAQKLRPRSIELLTFEQRWQASARQQQLAELRRQEFEREQKLALARKLRLEHLAWDAQQQRILAAQQAAAFGVEQKLLLDKKRRADQLAAHNQLLSQARVSFKAGNFQLSIQTFESALALHQSDDVYRELALARADLDRTNKKRLLAEAKLRETELELKKQKELTLARAKLEAETKKRLAEEAAARKAQEAKDNLEYQKLFDLGEKQMANQKYNEAISSLQAARRLKKTDQVETLLNQALINQARVVAEAKGDAARKELEQKLAQEKEARIKAEAEAKVNQDKYLALLKVAQKALAGRDYDTAINNFNEAGRIFKTDVVLTGLQKAKDAQQKSNIEANEAKQKVIAEQAMQAKFKSLMGEGQAALDAKDFAKALDKFSAASKLQPGNVDALAAQSKAEQARDQAVQEARQKTVEVERKNTFERLFKDGQDNLARKQFDAAIANLTEALKFNPGDAAATKALQTAQAAQVGAAKTAQQQTEAKKKIEDYQKAMTDGRLALQSKQFDAAIQSFELAQKLMPGDTASQNSLKDAQKLRTDLRAAEAAAVKQKAEEVQRQVDLKKALADTRTALASKNLAVADKAFALALKLAPSDPAVVQLQGELQKARDAVQADAFAQQKRKVQFDALMSSAQKSLDAKQFEAAIKSLNEANALMPGDKTNQALLTQAQQLQQQAAKTAGDQAAKKAAFEQAIKQGQAFMAAKKFDDAIKQFQLAASQQPGDPTAANLLKQAEASRNQETAAQQKTAEFSRLIKEGNAALAAKKFDQAVQSFGAAVKLNPGDAGAANLFKQAEAARNQEAAAQQKTAEFSRLIKEGNAALAAKKFDQAVQSFGAAVKLNPGDAGAANLFKQAEAARNQEAASQQKTAEFSRLIKEGNAALAAKKFDQAVQSFGAAVKLNPGDAGAANLFKQAEAARSQEAAAQQKTAEFSRLIKEGNAALAAKKFDQAVQSFGAAVKLNPADAGAAKALQNAYKLWDASKTPPGPNPAQVAEFNKQMQMGAGFDKKKQWPDAIKAYDAALKQMPKDAKASEAHKKATYNQHLAEGNRFLTARQFPNATAEFEAALRLYPNDADATAGLKKAKEGKEKR